MTVSTTTSLIAYTGDGVSTTFAVTFSFFDDEDLQVISRVTSTGVETVLTLTTDYTVTGGDGSTGAVVMTVAPAATVTITIRRVTTLTQGTDLSSFGPFPAQAVEEMADRLTMIAQETARDAIRTLILPVTESSLMLPSSVERAGKYLSFDGSGNPITASTVEVGSVVFSPFGETLVDDADASAVLDTLQLWRYAYKGFAGGTANAIIIGGVIPSPLRNGTLVGILASADNTSTVTVTGGGSTVPLYRDYDSTDVVAGDLRMSQPYLMVYDISLLGWVLLGASNAKLTSLAVADDNFSLALSGGNPRVTFDSTDYLEFDRATNRLAFKPAGTVSPLYVGSGVLTSDSVSMAQGWHLLESYTVASAPAQKDFVLSTYISRGYKRFMLDWRNLSPAAAALLMARFSVDAGSTFKTAGGDYTNGWLIWNSSASALGGSGVGYVQLSGTVNVQTAASHAAGCSGTLEFETDRSGIITVKTENRWVVPGPFIDRLQGQGTTTFAGPVNAVRIGFVSQNMENFGSVHLLGIAT